VFLASSSLHCFCSASFLVLPIAPQSFRSPLGWASHYYRPFFVDGSIPSTPLAVVLLLLCWCSFFSLMFGSDKHVNTSPPPIFEEVGLHLDPGSVLRRGIPVLCSPCLPSGNPTLASVSDSCPSAYGLEFSLSNRGLPPCRPF